MQISWIVLLLALPIVGQDLSKFPAWAQMAGNASLSAQVPQDADAWVVLEKTEFAYTGDGEIRKHQFRLVRILTERGTQEGAFAIHGLGGKTSRVKKLKGWNLRPNGEMIRLDSDTVATLGIETEGAAYSTSLVTTAKLDRVAKGSWVAFESLEVIDKPLGPFAFTYIMEENPIHQWEMNLAKSEGWFTNLKTVQLRLQPRHLRPWVATPLLTEASILLRDVPALPKDEGIHPNAFNALPWVDVAFLDPKQEGRPSVASWDTYAQWVFHAYLPRFEPIHPVALNGLSSKEALCALSFWMSRELSYKQVYLSPERGWMPESSTEVVRRHYGDCKDLAACFCGGAATLGLKPFPVLARVFEGSIEPDQPISPAAFNHVIAAVQLKESLGFPAEVATPKGRFLLVDLTARLTPLGWLPDSHRGHRVMICTEDGALWVEVPSAAIEKLHLDVTLQGNVTLEGALDATIHLTEEGNVHSIRGLTLTGTRKDLTQHLRDLLGVGSDATLEIVQVSDPLDVLHPLNIECKLNIQKAFRKIGSEFSLEQIGLPGLPSLVQKPGHPRQYPLEFLASDGWAFHADLKLPFPIDLVGATKKLDTPFRTVNWKSRLEGNHFVGDFNQTRRDARYGFDQQEEGVQQAKKDRQQLKTLLDEATAFKVRP